MSPTNPWGKNKHNRPSIPLGAPKPASPNQPCPSPGQKSEYEEIQEDELIALASIYGEDFQRTGSGHGAWKKSEPSFEIRIKSSLDEDIAVILAATLTATYPKTLPLLSIKGDFNLSDGTRFKIQKAIESKPKELLSEEQAMIMEIVNACQDVLEDAAQAKAAGEILPSLEEERALHEAAAAKEAEAQIAELKRKEELERLEEQRIQESMLQDELQRRKERTQESRRKNRQQTQVISKASIDPNVNSQAPYEILSFEQPINIFDAQNNQVSFQVVIGKTHLRDGPSSKCFTVRPLVPQGASEMPSLVLKQTDLDTEVKDNNKFKAQLQLLESELKSLKAARHRNILEMLDYKVHRKISEEGVSSSSWTVSVLTEFADKGSLQELLDIAGSLGVERIRSWTIELLEALRFLHEQGTIHGDIHPGNVLLVRSNDGEVRPKLADAGYQNRLRTLSGQRQPTDTISVAKSAYWLPPEIANDSQPQYTQKTDIWDFGILFLQMIFGLDVIQKHSSPSALTDSLTLSDPLNELVLMMFKTDFKKRPRAVELGPSEFLATDAPIMQDDESFSTSRFGSITSLLPTTPRKRHDSMNTGSSFLRSRYKEDFVEEGRLGKGGFGEVVKARKKLDGQIYAIKKIEQKSSASLTEVLKEVRLLSQLSHPSVVRYYNTWTEEVFDVSDVDADGTSNEFATEDDSDSDISPGHDSDLDITPSGGLDFMSSQGYPQIVFGSGSEDEDESEDEHDSSDEDDDSTSANGNGKIVSHAAKEYTTRTRSNSRYQKPFRTILYISMEYCEKQTLRDLIKRGLSKDDDEIWRLFRQILEGLAHIHGLNVVHRDLKPENVFIDAASNVKIGDFGLATSGQYTLADKSAAGASHFSGDMTRSIGTAFYVAPEVKSSVTGSYTSKVDMYSLGIIFFEMCFRPLIPGMDRAFVGEGLRETQPTFPPEFKTAEKPAQADIILSLLNHSPKERPSSLELLKSGKLPVQMETETIRQALAGLSDSKSPYYEKMMKTIFSLPVSQAKDYTWEMGASQPSANDLLLQGIVKQQLISIFRNHGAVESPRTVIFPRSKHYGPNAVQLLDENGSVLQLPYDLTLPLARAIAKNEPAVERSFAFGRIFRVRNSGSQPSTFSEVDFDIVSNDTLDLALKEAEVIKVLDEIVENSPALTSSQMCFHINHSDFVALIFDFCRIEKSIRPAVVDALSRLNIQWTWTKVRTELRKPLIGVSATSLDDLQLFDFRDTPSKAFTKFKTLLEDTDTYERASSSIAHLRDVIEYTKRFGLRSKLYVSPLSCINEKFYKGGIMFACLFDRKVKDVFAAGGRYDSLIREQHHKAGFNAEPRHAVGFNLAWEKLAKLPKSGGKGFLKKPDEDVHGIWNTKRCDVLVASHDATTLRTTGVEMIQKLWSNDISAELARDSRSPEELLNQYRNDLHSWIVIIKQDSMLKIKSMASKDIDDVDIPSHQLLAWLKSEIRERDQRHGTHQRARLHRGNSKQTSKDNYSNNDREQDVRVLVAGTKTKKSNRRNIVEQAHAKALSLTQEFLEGPIAAIETTDQVLEMIRATKLSDAESWRQVMHAVPKSETRYVGEIHELLGTLAEGREKESRHAFVYNFRTGKCVYYDLGA